MCVRVCIVKISVAILRNTGGVTLTLASVEGWSFVWGTLGHAEALCNNNQDTWGNNAGSVMNF